MYHRNHLVEQVDPAVMAAQGLQLTNKYADVHALISRFPVYG
jgi:hypothetical protein